jgi:hypothetical protein
LCCVVQAEQAKEIGELAMEKAFVKESEPGFYRAWHGRLERATIALNRGGTVPLLPIPVSPSRNYVDGSKSRGAPESRVPLHQLPSPAALHPDTIHLAEKI